METHAAPIWDLPVDAIDTAAVLGVLQPIWQAAPETASRVRGEIEAVLDSRGAKFPFPREPRTWRGHLNQILPPARTQLSRNHYAAMDYRELPAFIAAISHDLTMRAMALEFLILTAARWGEVWGARWSEIDLAAKVWTIPQLV